MFRRFLYYFFWNFYDSLGTYLLAGMVVTFPAFGLCVFFAFMASAASGVLLQSAMVLLGTIVIATIIVLATAGMFHFADIASRDEPARWVHFRTGMRLLWRRFAIAWLVYGGAVLIAATNILFYLKITPTVESSTARLATVFATILFVWLLAGIFVFGLPYFASMARFNAEKRWKSSARKAFVVFALAPFYWVGVAIFIGSLLVLALASIAGSVFVLPLIASGSTTALNEIVVFTDFLTGARKELGENQSVSAYRRKALLLASEAEARKQHRGFRDLIKPWEM